MTKIYILAALLTFSLGFFGTKAYYQPTVSEEFKLYTQYDPEYIGYTDEQMLLTCGHYGLVYNYSNAECE